MVLCCGTIVNGKRENMEVVFLGCDVNKLEYAIHECFEHRDYGQIPNVRGAAFGYCKKSENENPTTIIKKCFSGIDINEEILIFFDPRRMYWQEELFTKKDKLGLYEELDRKELDYMVDMLTDVLSQHRTVKMVIIGESNESSEKSIQTEVFFRLKQTGSNIKLFNGPVHFLNYRFYFDKLRYTYEERQICEFKDAVKNIDMIFQLLHDDSAWRGCLKNDVYKRINFDWYNPNNEYYLKKMNYLLTNTSNYDENLVETVKKISDLEKWSKQGVEVYLQRTSKQKAERALSRGLELDYHLSDNLDLLDLVCDTSLPLGEKEINYMCNRLNLPDERPAGVLFFVPKVHWADLDVTRHEEVSSGRIKQFVKPQYILGIHSKEFGFKPNENNSFLSEKQM